jgi:tetratricopeptide (TPR) repeat protein
MTKSISRSIILPAAIVIVGIVAAAVLSGQIERVRPAMPDGYDDSDLSMHGSAIKGYALGMEGLLADWYWMRALQYVGNKILNARAEDVNLDDLRNLNPRLLYPYLENATDLDPHFMAAYTYGALVMPAIDAEKAIEITKKGIAHNPDQWRLYQHLGYIYWKLGRYDEAADAYEQGAQIPGAGGFMGLMAATMRTEGGSRETAREIFRQMLAGTDDPAIKITAERRLAELDWQDEREAIDKVLAEFRARNGRCVSDLAEIMPMLMRVRLPDGHDFRIDKSNRLVDPTGAPYQLDRENCRVKLDPEKSGLPSTARTE